MNRAKNCETPGAYYNESITPSGRARRGSNRCAGKLRSLSSPALDLRRSYPVAGGPLGTRGEPSCPRNGVIQPKNPSPNYHYPLP
nr:MAG TPA: hypothetical protein [Caudoviricetes sp.]